MFVQYEHVRIAGISVTAPENVVDNENVAKSIGEKRTLKQIKLTGIKKRHVLSKGQTASDLACIACERLLKKLSWNREDIRVLIYATQAPDLATPSTAMIIQKRLRIGKDCIAFDINLGCSAYSSGLQIVAGLLRSIGGKGVLLTADGRYIDPSTVLSSNSLLFGHGGSATAIEVDNGGGFSCAQFTDGSRYELLYRPLRGASRMDGNGILMFSLNEVTQSIRDMLQYYSIDKGTIDFFVMHQAQKLVLDGMQQELGIPSDKMLNSYEEFGNTTTSTIPVTICHNLESISKVDKATMLMCGFGVGLAWSTVITTIDTSCVLPIEFTDYTYGDLPE